MFNIKRSPISGFLYAVFQDEDAAFAMEWLFYDHPISCFGGYMNAYCLSVKGAAVDE